MPKNAPATPRPVVPAAVRTALAAAVIFSFWGAINYYQQETAFQGQGPNRDPYLIQAAEQRLAEFRQAVPENAVLGFITDAPNGTLGTVLADSAQYALAPRLLKRGPNADLVLGIFTKPGDFQIFGARLGLHLERDFGQGVVLFRRVRE